MAAAMMEKGQLGRMAAPGGGSLPEGVWAADNGCFNAATFDEAKWWAWLTRMTPHAESCLFAVAPDVVGDWDATLARSVPWLPRIYDLGYRTAIVLQNGATPETVPWDLVDVVFIGGDTAWKLGEEARLVVDEAKRRGRKVHMGRVNSYRRYRYASLIGCDTVDGTFLAFGPSVNIKRLRSWLHDQGDLFAATDRALS